jgi:hypothetical protein
MKKLKASKSDTCLLYCLVIDKVFFQLTDEDQEQYKDFDMVVSARWQEEMCGQLLTQFYYRQSETIIS